MGFPGTWMTESESVVYRVVPKCACSTIGQIMFYSDHGRFFDGDIHDSKDGLHKWGQEDSNALITQNVQAHKSYSFNVDATPTPASCRLSLTRFVAFNGTDGAIVATLFRC